MFVGLPGEKGDRGLPGKYHHNNTTIKPYAYLVILVYI